MEIVHIDDLGKHVENVCRQVRRGVYAINQSGMTARMPEKIDFDVIVIAQNGFQALEVSKDQVSENNETQGGSTEESQTSKEEGKTVTDDKTVQDGTRETTGSDVTKGSETQNHQENSTSSETGSSQDESSQTTEEDQVGRNTYNQTDHRTETHDYEET